MKIVDLKCPNCGAAIQLDADNEVGFCSFCGTKIMVQEEISKVRIDKTSETQNYLSLSQTAIDSGNGQEAYDYANKVLEIDPKNSEAWYCKMQALGAMAILKDLRCNEIVTAGNKAIEYDNSPEMKQKVYNYFLFTCLGDLKFCMGQLQDTKTMKDLYDANCAVDPFNATQKTLESDGIADLILKQENLILGLRFAVPDEEITNNESLTNQTVEVAKQWVYYQNAVNARFNVYGTSINDESLNGYKQNLNLIKRGLPETHKDSVSDKSMTNEAKSGCYIATAVYGSYDTPEVMVLRHFRDYSLRSTALGRCFIKMYYKFSPTIAERLKNAHRINSWVRIALDKWVNHLNK